MTNKSEYAHIRCRAGMAYYEALQINISASGYYRFSIHSTIDTYGYLYRDLFDPFDPSRNQIASDDDSCDNGQFRLDYFLQKSETYTLVVTTFMPNDIGEFTVIALSEAHRVNFTRLGEYHCRYSFNQ